MLLIKQYNLIFYIRRTIEIKPQTFTSNKNIKVKLQEI